REVQEVRRREPEIDHAHASRGDPRGERGGDVGRRETAVPADHHLRPARELRERGADPASEVFVEIVGDDAPHVVRLEDAVQVVDGHGRHPTEGCGRPSGGMQAYCWTTRPITDWSG